MRGVMTQSRLDSFMSQGYGSGRDESYSSWIRVRRRTSSPVSNLYRFMVPLYKRPIHLLSGLEHSAANVALWLGVKELREQHPLWPNEHLHPSAGRNPDLDRRLPLVPGLLELAKHAGIEHGVYPGTRLPFVATIDFTLSTRGKTERLVHWSCKPRAVLDSAPNRQRMLERINLEELYSTAVGAKHVVIDGSDFTGHLAGNLDWWRPLRSEWVDPGLHGCMEEFGSHVMSVADESVSFAKRYAANKMRLLDEVAETLFRMCAWSGAIDIDPYAPVIMARPLARGGFKRKKELCHRLLGECDA